MDGKFANGGGPNLLLNGEANVIKSKGGIIVDGKLCRD